MRKTFLAAMIGIMLAPVALAANWQSIARDAEKRIELDKSRVEGGKLVAWSRVVLARPAIDASGGQRFVIVEALNRYDCEGRGITTLRRHFIGNDEAVLREERIPEPKQVSVAAGTLDEKLFNEVCKPAKGNDLQKVTDAAADAGRAAAPKLGHADLKSAPAAEQARVQRVSTDAHAAPATNASPATASSHDADRIAPIALSHPRRKTVLAVAPAAPIVAPQHVDQHAHWSYEGETGPVNWGTLKPEYATCNKGSRQSPIDVRDGIRVDLPEIQFD